MLRPRLHALVVTATLMLAVAAPAAHAAFGISSFSATVLKSDLTTPETQAGAHPYVGITQFTFNTVPLLGTPDGNVKDIRVDLPPGLISNPEATPKCSATDFATNHCDPSTQIGTEDLTVGTTL